MKPKLLTELINVNHNFKTSINLSLNINDHDKLGSFIPTTSSVVLLNEYLDSIIDKNDFSTLLIGPYGKGKSHLVLVLLAIISWRRDLESNRQTIYELCEKIKRLSEQTVALAEKIWNYWNTSKPFLPVIISNTGGSVAHSFMIGLKNALSGVGTDFSDIVPTTFHSHAIERINNWKISYQDTYAHFVELLQKSNITVDEIIEGLKKGNDFSLKLFRDLYPELTSGSQFTPLIDSDTVKIFDSVNYKLIRDRNFAGIYIVFDEFSKFIEAQNSDTTGMNMKLVQDMCELANNSKDNQLFLTMISHKTISEYHDYLSQDVINSYIGIEGRIKERFFVSSSQNNFELISSAIGKNKKYFDEYISHHNYFQKDFAEKYLELPCFTKSFSNDVDSLRNLLLCGCFPLTPISAYVLLNVSEKVAQNERSLFTFISKRDPFSLAEYINTAEFNETDAPDQLLVNCDLIYDYFENLIKKSPSSKIHNIWINSSYALEKSTKLEQEKIIKSLALLLIICKSEFEPTLKNIRLASGVDNADLVLVDLVECGIVSFSEVYQTYRFATVDGNFLKNKIEERRTVISENDINVSEIFSEVFERNFWFPKKYNNKYYITRYLRTIFMELSIFTEIKNVDDLLKTYDSSDGLVIYLYSLSVSLIDEEHIRNHLYLLDDPRIVVVLSDHVVNTDKYKIDYTILHKMLNDVNFMSNHSVLESEILLKIAECKEMIKRELASLFSYNAKVFRKESQNVVKTTYADIFEFINDSMENAFHATPVINNEVINRKNLSSAQTKKTRLNIINAILNHEDDENFYCGTSQDATIYRSLFCVTQINNNTATENFRLLFEKISDLISRAVENKVHISSLINELISPPIGLRLSVIPIYLAYIFAKRNSLPIIYNKGNEIDVSAQSLVDLTEKPGDYQILVPSNDAVDEDYLNFLDNKFSAYRTFTKEPNTIKRIFLAIKRWLRGLPSVSRNLVAKESVLEDEHIRNVLSSFIKLFMNDKNNYYETVMIKLPSLCENGKTDFSNYEKIVEIFDNYLEKVLDGLVTITYDVFEGKKGSSLTSILKYWQEKLPECATLQVEDSVVSDFLSYIHELNTFDDHQVIEGLVKIIVGVNVEDLSQDSLNYYKNELNQVKERIEKITDSDVSELRKLTFYDKDGNEVSHNYKFSNNDDTLYFRNMLEEFIKTYPEMNKNDKVSVLVEVIHSIIQEK